MKHSCPDHLGSALPHPLVLASLHPYLRKALWWALGWTPAEGASFSAMSGAPPWPADMDRGGC